MLYTKENIIFRSIIKCKLNKTKYDRTRLRRDIFQDDIRTIDYFLQNFTVIYNIIIIYYSFMNVCIYIYRINTVRTINNKKK